MNSMKIIESRKNLKIDWIPSLICILENEIADSLAKTACELRHSDESVMFEPQDLKNIVKKETLKL